MKNLLRLSVMTVVVLVLSSCNKDNNVSNNTVFNKTQSGEVATAPIITIKIEGKPYRPVGAVNKKGIDCNCSRCFGLCEVKITVGLGFNMIIENVIPIGVSVQRLYLLELPANGSDFDEDGFVIDNDISIQVSNSEYGFSNLIFKSGEYTFINKTGVYVENGIQYSYLGYVDITVEAN